MIDEYYQAHEYEKIKSHPGTVQLVIVLMGANSESTTEYCTLVSSAVSIT